MARIEWIEQRLQNWARWKLMRGSGALGYAAVNLTGLADANAGRDGYITASIPISDVEASETDEAVQRLPGELRATIETVYVGNGTLNEKLARLCVAKPTLHARVERSHRMLADHFHAAQDKRKAERERVEALQRGLRPA